MQPLLAIIILSILVEAITEYSLPTFPERWKWLKVYIAAAAAVLLALAYEADLPAAVGLPRVAYVGPIITGLVMGRGSNYLNMIVKRIQVITAPAQAVTDVPRSD